MGVKNSAPGKGLKLVFRSHVCFPDATHVQDRLPFTPIQNKSPPGAVANQELRIRGFQIRGMPIEGELASVDMAGARESGSLIAGKGWLRSGDRKRQCVRRVSAAVRDEGIRPWRPTPDKELPVRWQGATCI